MSRARVELRYHFRIDDPENRVLILERRPNAIDDMDAFVAEVQAILDSLGPLHQTWGTIVDPRAAVGRSDPDFEEVARWIRRAFLEKTSRFVILMRSSVGLLQGKRLTDDADGRVLLTKDEEQAVRFASGAAAVS